MRRIADILNKVSWICFPAHDPFRGVTRGIKRGILGSAEQFQQCCKNFFTTVHLLPKDFIFEHGGAKLISCHRHILTSLPPCAQTFFCNFQANIFRSSKTNRWQPTCWHCNSAQPPFNACESHDRGLLKL